MIDSIPPEKRTADMAHRKKLKKSVKIIIGTVVAAALLITGIFIIRHRNAKTANETVKEPQSAETHNEELPVVTQEPEPTPTPTPEVEESSFSLFMVGDGLIHGAVYQTAGLPDGSYDFKPMLDRIGEIARQYDLAYYNQETILGGTEMGLSSFPVFNSPQEFGVNMIEEGFDLVSTATNHSMDMGAAGVESQYNFWKSHEDQILMEGTNLSWEERNEISVRECNGISYAFLSWTFGTNGIPMPEGQEYLVNSYTGYEEEMLDQVRRASEMADVVIMAIHWGTEYADYPDDHQLWMAQALSDAGCDIIIGNHPHMIQPVQWINGNKTICFYALGNLISAQFDDSLVGMMGAVTINKRTENGKTEITLSDVKADLHWTYGEAVQWLDIGVYPFTQLNDSICPGYQELYGRMSQIITALDSNIQVGGF